MTQACDLRKTALATLLAAAGLVLSAPLATARAADTNAADTTAPAAATSSSADHAAAPSKYVVAGHGDQVLADHLIGMDVKNGEDDDKDVGKISDVLIDRDGHITAVVVEVGGFLGMGKKDVGMPWDRIQGVDTDDNVVHVNATTDELKEAPEFRDQSSQEKRDEAVREKRADADVKSDTETTRSAYHVMSQDGNQFLASKLMDMEVVNEQDKDEKVGKISDVILNMDGKASGLVVGVGGLLGIGKKDVGMPWDRVQGVDAEDKLVLANVTKDELKDAPEYKKPEGQ